MKIERKNIGLLEMHRGKSSSMFTGRPQGEEIRKLLGLDTFDEGKEKYFVNIPSGTTSINPSFFLGLFYPSIKKLGGYDNFKDKYLINIETDNEILKKGLIQDLDDCERQARNEFSHKTGLSLF